MSRARLHWGGVVLAFCCLAYAALGCRRETKTDERTPGEQVIMAEPTASPAPPLPEPPVPEYERSIALPMAARDAPRWVGPEAPPAANRLAWAKGKTTRLEQPLPSVASFDVIPQPFSGQITNYDFFTYDAGFWQNKAGAGVFFGPDAEPRSKWRVRRSWPVTLRGGSVQVSIAEYWAWALVRIAPTEWLDATLEDRLEWARWALPRIVQLRGTDQGGHRFATELSYRAIDARRAELTTATWSAHPQMWHQEVSGEIDDRGVTLYYRRVAIGTGPHFGSL